jgi:hypothetical protein
MVAPGEFTVINTGTRTTPLVEFGEFLNGEGFARWDHACLCSRVDPDGTIWIIEADPSGIKEREWPYENRPHLWSTDRVPTSPLAAIEARKYIGQKYSWADYYALAAHRLDIPVPGLKQYIGNSHHMICSQLVDQAELDAGVHLFTDGRWPGYVTPQALGVRILQGG